MTWENGGMVMARYNHGSFNSEQFPLGTGSYENKADAGIMLDNMHNEVLKNEIMIEALLSLMAEQGISREQINQKIIELTDKKIANRVYETKSSTCPKCGKTVLEAPKIPLRGRCMYCGTYVTFYPLLEEEKPAEESPAPGDGLI